MTNYVNQDDHKEVVDLLVGRKVVSVAINRMTDEGRAVLDDGTVLTLRGNEGGCSCSSGDYLLTELNQVDNIITNVELVDAPEDKWGDRAGQYKIYVVADNQRINFATFEGDDGNGYYGTGYSIQIEKPVWGSS